MFWSTYLLWQCHFLHNGKNSMHYWRSFMTVGRPTAHWAQKIKRKKKIFGRRKIVPIIHPNICDWVITSSHVKMCTITFIEVTSHWVGTRDCIFAMISPLPCRRVAVVRGGGAGRWCGAGQGRAVSTSNRVWCFTAAPDNSLCFQMFSSRSSSLKLLACLSPTTFNSAKSRSFNGVAQIYWSWSMLGIFSIR